MPKLVKVIYYRSQPVRKPILKVVTHMSITQSISHRKAITLLVQRHAYSLYCLPSKRARSQQSTTRKWLHFKRLHYLSCLNSIFGYQWNKECFVTKTLSPTYDPRPLGWLISVKVQIEIRKVSREAGKVSIIFSSPHQYSSSPHHQINILEAIFEILRRILLFT